MWVDRKFIAGLHPVTMFEPNQEPRPDRLGIMMINISTQSSWRSANGKPLRGEQARQAIDSFRPHQSQSSDELHHGFVQTQKGARLFSWHRTRLRERVKISNGFMLAGFAAVAAAPIVNGPVGVALLAGGGLLSLASMYAGFGASSQAGEADSFARELQHKADLYRGWETILRPWIRRALRRWTTRGS